MSLANPFSHSEGSEAAKLLQKVRKEEEPRFYGLNPETPLSPPSHSSHSFPGYSSTRGKEEEEGLRP